MVKYKLTIEYDGTSYRGWQTQLNARSIQGTLTDAAKKILGPNIELQGAGRTDAGVHALAQVAHIGSEKKMQPRSLLEGLNDLLPSNINVKEVEEAPADFHARHHAKMRSYVYIISKRRTAFGKRYVWWIKDKLDMNRMRDVLELYRGFHDFASFADKRLDKDASTLVKLHTVEMHEIGDLVVVRIVASHFLWKMVRRMVGIMVEAGRRNLFPPDIERMLTGKSEIPAKFTAPSSGLFLEKVFYEGDVQNPIKLPPLPLLLGK
jgi:tRNA pseudouridine38-40 synthase